MDRHLWKIKLIDEHPTENSPPLMILIKCQVFLSRNPSIFSKKVQNLRNLTLSVSSILKILAFLKISDFVAIVTFMAILTIMANVAIVAI